MGKCRVQVSRRTLVIKVQLVLQMLQMTIHQSHGSLRITTGHDVDYIEMLLMRAKVMMRCLIHGNDERCLRYQLFEIAHMMYCEKVVAKPAIGRAMIQARVSFQNGKKLVTMSRKTPLGMTV